MSFSAKDLETAHAIQAGLNPTEQQVAATAGKVDANKQAIQAVSGEEAALSKRFGELGDYDVKAESEVFFAVGKADRFADASGSREGACE